MYKLFSTPEPFFRSIATNGVSLDRILFSECLENIDIIQISLRGYNESVFAASAQANPSLFYKIQENIEKLLRLKKNLSKSPQLTAKITVTESNYLELDKMFEYCDSFGFDAIVVKLSGNFETGQDVELTDDELIKVKEILKEIADKHPEYHCLDSISDNRTIVNELEECWAIKHRTNVLVRPNGDLYLCIVSPNSEENKIGNVDESIIKVWNGPKHINVIEKLSCDMKNGNCHLGICRHYRYNYFLDKLHKMNKLVEESKKISAPKLL